MSDQQVDYRKLMRAILCQAMDDYIKMQHPRYRKRKYEREAFWSARDLLWNDGHTLAIEDAEGNFTTLATLCAAAADRENADVENLRAYLLAESKAYWKEKQVRTIEIPEDVVVEGHAYRVQHQQDPEIDFDEKIIYLNKESPTAEEQFMQLVLDLTCHHNEIKTSVKARKELGKSLYRILKLNSCFVGDS